MKIDIKQITSISIKNYLQQIGISPIKDRGYYGMYFSPFRADTSPSMKVDYNKNLWIDYGLNEGGSIIDLVMKLERCTVKEAIEKLSNGTYLSDPSFSFHCNESIQENNIELIKVKPIRHRALKDYLESRCIKEEVYQHYCKEIHYRVKDGKEYFAVGFENVSGGYELRSKYFKGCMGKKDISFIKNNSTTLCVFEGFVDFLSALCYDSVRGNLGVENEDIIILNSISNAKRIHPLLYDYSTIALFLDNDIPGQKCASEIKQQATKEIIDGRHIYKDYKDLNEYLIYTSQNNK
ncbi:MAG: toprim domain-containing protein [Prevotella sp.]|jgi:hypothetical protein|nr:toprim domain-containing protein [Prevotella sp.]